MFSNTSVIVDGKAKFVIDIEDLIGLQDALIVNATLTEAQTNIAEYTSIKIYIQKHKYSITASEDEIEFLNEIPYRIKAKVQHLNGTIVKDLETTVVMKHGPKCYEARLDDKGVTTFEFDYSQNPYPQIFYMIYDVRSYLPETWLFEDFEISTPTETMSFHAPDSITTWVLTAFSLNEETGIGIMDPTFNITASKQFFISTYLPYSIKRGEIVSIPIVIFNYHAETLRTEVIMENSLSQFKFVDDTSNETTNSLSEKRNIIVPAKAKNELATDAVLQKLLVEPDGFSIARNQEVYVSVTPEEDVNIYFETNMPINVAPDSEFLLLSISGNVLLPSLNNLDVLVEKPTGCGKQNMIHFAPNILVLEYLCATRQTSKYAELVAKAKKYLKCGYQNQLKFRHSNGGYSVFGNGRSIQPEFRHSNVGYSGFGNGRSCQPSKWLTAYVLRFFIKALKYMSIKSSIIESSLNYLTTQQLSGGEFQTAGYLFHPAYQSRNGFTAFVLMAFLENAKYARKHKTVVQKALDFLSNNIHEIDDIYSLAIMATAFQMAKHEQASLVLEKLKPLAKNSNGLQWWEDNSDYRVTDIEITSYILLALLYTPGQYLPIAKWLLEQRNVRGGFKSTQDTVVGLQALIKFFQLTVPQKDTLKKVSCRALSIQKEELENVILGLDPDTVNILQDYEIPT
ncbi:C3 and PZP-like alpha-2-macroglobulin domain-containing protein 8 [Lucilia sericata]|uniref:C3 and PZP-like alpha-2-macroglobulin domain-containing protein 8 n=1 Tax=Lucilia sericata TaxID=13632 RepID=UPI0018A855AD|nr:C3 and PZP-like alpha-2-macroglobulin domain-containing protein 8 [Lucilia sericata]